MKHNGIQTLTLKIFVSMGLARQQCQRVLEF